MLEVKNLTTQYVTSRNIVHAVNNVSFSLPNRTILGIINKTSSNKSTTIQSIVGLLQQPKRVVTKSAKLNNADLIHIPRRELRHHQNNVIGYIKQNPFASLNPMLRINQQFENVTKTHQSINRKTTYALTHKRLLQINIHNPNQILNGFTHKLNNSITQRVVIAIATLLNPRIIITNEPTTALNLTVQHQIINLLHKLIKTKNYSVLLITHDLDVVTQYCNRIAVMFTKHVLKNNPIHEMFHRPTHPYTTSLITSAPTASQPLIPPTNKHNMLNLINYPNNYPYQSRCASAVDICEHAWPTPTSHKTNAHVSCHRPNDHNPNATEMIPHDAARS